MKGMPCSYLILLFHRGMGHPALCSKVVQENRAPSANASCPPRPNQLLLIRGWKEHTHLTPSSHRFSCEPTRCTGPLPTRQSIGAGGEAEDSTPSLIKSFLSGACLTVATAVLLETRLQLWPNKTRGTRQRSPLLSHPSICDVGFPSQRESFEIHPPPPSNLFTQEDSKLGHPPRAGVTSALGSIKRTTTTKYPALRCIPRYDVFYVLIKILLVQK